jgi:hypothetical protein
MDIHELAKQHLPGDYTVIKREFTDGDSRTLAKHAQGHGELGCATEFTLWKELGQIWVEYYEHDIQRDRRVLPYELQERVV